MTGTYKPNDEFIKKLRTYDSMVKAQRISKEIFQEHLRQTKISSADKRESFVKLAGLLISEIGGLDKETKSWKPIDQAPKNEKNLVLKNEHGNIFAPCEWSPDDGISEVGFWMCWVPVDGVHFVEVVNPVEFFKVL